MDDGLVVAVEDDVATGPQLSPSEESFEDSVGFLELDVLRAVTLGYRTREPEGSAPAADAEGPRSVCEAVEGIGIVSDDLHPVPLDRIGVPPADVEPRLGRDPAPGEGGREGASEVVEAADERARVGDDLEAELKVARELLELEEGAGWRGRPELEERAEFGELVRREAGLHRNRVEL